MNLNKRVHVSITPSTVIITILIGFGAYLLWLLRGLSLLVLTAIVIASAIEPGVTFFKRWKLPRVVAVFIMYVMVFGSFFGLIYFFLPPILNDTQNFVSSIPQYLNTLNLPFSFSGTALGSSSSGAYQSQSVFQTLLAFRSAFSSDTSEGTFQLVSSFFGGILSFIIVVVLSFYFAVQETGVEDFLKLVTPSEHEGYVVGLWQRARTKIGQWMQGQIILSVLMAVVIYLCLVILQVPDALLIAAFTAVAEVIPIFGSFIAWFPAVIIAYTAGAVPMALYVTGVFVVVNQLEGNLIHPLVVRKVVGVPPLLVLLAIVAGGTLAGFLGVVLAVPLAAVIREALSDFARRKQRLSETNKPEPRSKALHT